MSTRITGCFVALALCAACAAAWGREVPDFEADTLTGDWGGLRSDWYRAGALFEATYKLDLSHNASGGLRRGTTAVGLFEGKLRTDFEQMFGWANTSGYLHVLSHAGGQPNAEFVGSSLGVNNNEVIANTFRVFHAWVQRTFWDNRVSLLFGLYPIDSEFHVTEAAGVFIHPTLGAPGEQAASGKAGPSVYNTSAVGIRLRVQPDPTWYGMVAVLDGVPGDPNNPRGTHIRFDRGDGAMAIAEFGWRPLEAGHPDEPISPELRVPQTPEREAEEMYEPTAKYAFGYWQYTPLFDDLFATDPATGNPKRSRSRGAYMIAERSLYIESADPSQGLVGFARYGVASERVNPVARTASVGLIYTGLFPGRNEDVLGLSITRGRASDSLRKAQPPLDRTETAWELTYRAQLIPWLAVQPSLQRIVNPAFNPELRNAWVFQTRFEVEL